MSWEALDSIETTIDEMIEDQKKEAEKTLDDLRRLKMSLAKARVARVAYAQFTAEESEVKR